MEDEEIVDLNSVIIGLRQELEQRKDIEEKLNKNGIANTIIRTEYYTGILTIVEN